MAKDFNVAPDGGSTRATAGRSLPPGAWDARRCLHGPWHLWPDGRRGPVQAARDRPLRNDLRSQDGDVDIYRPTADTIAAIRSSPQSRGGEPRTLHERLELRPHDGRVLALE